MVAEARRRNPLPDVPDHMRDCFRTVRTALHVGPLPGGVYDTARERANMKGGPHGPEAVAHMVWYVGQWIAPPGFSHHQNGKAIDLQQEREPGDPLPNSRDTT